VSVPSQEIVQSCILCVRCVDSAYFYDFSIGYWKCSKGVVFFLSILLV